MSPLVQVFAIAIGVGLLALSVPALVKRQMSELQAAMWIAAGILAVILGFFPVVIIRIAQALGVSWPPAVLLLITIVCLGFIVFGQTKDIAKLQYQNTELAERVSLLVHDLQERDAEKLRKAAVEADPEACESSGAQEGGGTR